MNFSFGRQKKYYALSNITYYVLLMLLQKIVNEFNHKPKKISVDKSGEFYSKKAKSQLNDNDIETYSTHNE